MKFEVDKVSFLKVLDRARGATDAKAPMPILSHVLLRADPDTIMGCVWVSATDLFIGITNNVHCSVDDGGEGSIALPARDLYDRIKLMPDGNVRVSTEGTAVTLKSCVKGAARRYKMQGLPAAEFPTIPSCGPDPSVRIYSDAGVLADGLDRSCYASSHDETRTHLNAVLIEEKADKLSFVATDGHRLAISRAVANESESPSDNLTQLILPLRAAREIMKMCQECAANKHADRAAVLKADGPHVFLSVNGFEFSAKLVDGSFPPYQQIVPDKTSHTVKLDRRETIASLKAIAISTGENGGVSLSFSANKLSIEATSVKGEGSDELECDWSGPERKYGFNARYLIDALESIDSDFVTLGVSNELDPGIISSSDGGNQTAIVMPMRI